jgi:hypothetical protein
MSSTSDTRPAPPSEPFRLEHRDAEVEERHHRDGEKDALHDGHNHSSSLSREIIAVTDVTPGRAGRRER